MFVRKTIAGVIAAALTASAVALEAGPASAAVDPDDTTLTPATTDLIGVGSATSQHALKLIADAWERDQPEWHVATYAATGGGTISLPSGDIGRPNGSDAGKGLLYGSGNNTDIDFVRSSSAISSTEAQNGLQAFPFALDTLVMAVSNSTPSNAPASLTPAQIVGIYQGEITNWSEVGGQAGTIAPKIPQSGSGTRSFFTAELKAMNGGVEVALGQNVAEVQEQDDAEIRDNANAIAPFSKGRAGLLGNTLRREQGWSAHRALYNVVRGADIDDYEVRRILGLVVCSNNARGLIEAAGFQQLATPDHGGVCGVPTQSETTNFAANKQVVTTTSLRATCPQGNTAKLIATVSGSTSPRGTVDFLEGRHMVANNVPLVSGVATFTATGLPMGGHTFTAIFEPSAAFEPSEDEASVLVKGSATITESFPARVASGDRAKGTVKVVGDDVTSGGGGVAGGGVKIIKGSQTLASGPLRSGKVTFTLPKLPKGQNTLKVVYAGDSDVAGSTKSFTITQG